MIATETATPPGGSSDCRAPIPCTRSCEPGVIVQAAERASSGKGASQARRVPTAFFSSRQIRLASRTAIMRVRITSTHEAIPILSVQQATSRYPASAAARSSGLRSLSCKESQSRPMRWRPALTFRVPWHAERGLSASVIRSSTSASPGFQATSCRLNLASPPDNGYISASNPATLERLKSADPDELQIWPDFLNEQDQRVLLGAALKKLDATVGGREERKRRREWIKREKMQGELVGAPLHGSSRLSELSRALRQTS